jgi:hypothetical protein
VTPLAMARKHLLDPARWRIGYGGRQESWRIATAAGVVLNGPPLVLAVDPDLAV